MKMSDAEEELDVGSKISMVAALRARCETVMHEAVELQKRDGFEGLYRYTNALNAEIGFLDKLLEDPTRIKKEYIQSSNLSYLEAVHEAMASTCNIKEIMQLMSVPPSDDRVWMPRAAQMRNRSVKVDVVAESGLVWIKVIARNAKGLRFDMAGLEHEDEDEEDELSSDDDDFAAAAAVAGGFDQLPIFKKAREYLASASAHQVHFRTPLVVFAFMRLDAAEDGLIERIMNQLRDMGIVVHTAASAGLEDTYKPLLGDWPLTSLSTPALNLDVSTVLALISEMAHNPCEPSQVEGEALQIQAGREQIAPALPVLKAIVEGKELCMVQSAYDRLENIVNIVGGHREQARFRFLFRKDEHDDAASSSFDRGLWTQLPPLQISVIPDKPSDRFKRLLEPPSQKGKLNNGRKIRTRFSEFHAVIFGSGDAYRMTTVTAIQWMETALADAGLTSIAIISHEPRSLAEQKMRVS
ncbi:hypothetical protein BX666DRAFT_1947502 [Dichotomocladium elegans]|nr:hypothetical protein BX666DRAFT_1947502 [Dichotomocladium elegans]